MSGANKRVWWTVDFAEMPKFKVPDFKTDQEALAYVEKIRALADPSIRPTALMKWEETTSVESWTFPLTTDPTKIVEKVRAKLLAVKAEPNGQDGLEWAVRATMEAMNE